MDFVVSISESNTKMVPTALRNPKNYCWRWGHTLPYIPLINPTHNNLTELKDLSVNPVKIEVSHLSI